MSTKTRSKKKADKNSKKALQTDTLSEDPLKRKRESADSSQIDEAKPTDSGPGDSKRRKIDSPERTETEIEIGSQKEEIGDLSYSDADGDGQGGKADLEHGLEGSSSSLPTSGQPGVGRGLFTFTTMFPLLQPPLPSATLKPIKPSDPDHSSQRYAARENSRGTIEEAEGERGKESSSDNKNTGVKFAGNVADDEFYLQQVIELFTSWAEGKLPVFPADEDYEEIGEDRFSKIEEKNFRVITGQSWFEEMIRDTSWRKFKANFPGTESIYLSQSNRPVLSSSSSSSSGSSASFSSSSSSYSSSSSSALPSSSPFSEVGTGSHAEKLEVRVNLASVLARADGDGESTSILNAAKSLPIMQHLYVYDLTITESAALAILAMIIEDRTYLCMDAQVQGYGSYWLYAHPILPRAAPWAINLTPTEQDDVYASRLTDDMVCRLPEAPRELQDKVPVMTVRAHTFLQQVLQESPLMVLFYPHKNNLLDRRSRVDQKQRARSMNQMSTSGFRTATPYTNRPGIGGRQHRHHLHSSTLQSSPRSPTQSRQISTMATSSRELPKLGSKPSHSSNPSSWPYGTLPPHLGGGGGGGGRRGRRRRRKWTATAAYTAAGRLKLIC
jgi:hypothetical protein